MKYLLDTCLISELIKKHPNQKIVTWVNSIDERNLYLSVITIGEISKGIEKLPQSKRKQELEAWLNKDLLLRFRERIFTVDLSVMITWGKLVGQLEKRGQPISALDSLIAAITIHYNYYLVSRNEKDFQATKVNIINSWL
jgi:tRNA(fMet)-specific endonuclease VapC